jgi:hypothetical protein
VVESVDWAGSSRRTFGGSCPLTSRRSWKWGRRLSPGVAFHDLDEIAAAPEFDGRVLHLPLDEPQCALEYVHGRLKPGGWFLVDVRVGLRTTGPRGWPGKTGSTAPADFRELYGPLFTVEPVALFNSGPDAQAGHERGGGPDCRLPAAHLTATAPAVES